MGRGKGAEDELFYSEELDHLNLPSSTGTAPPAKKSEPLSLDIAEWESIVRDRILREWADLEWPNGICIDFDEAGEYASGCLAQDVEIVFDEDQFYECLNKLEAEIAKAQAIDMDTNF